jgi:hypothetical protein
MIDSTLAIQKDQIPLVKLEDWIEDQKDLSSGMVDMIISQFGATDGKLDLQEFISFVKVTRSHLYSNIHGHSIFLRLKEAYKTCFLRYQQ